MSPYRVLYPTLAALSLIAVNPSLAAAHCQIDTNIDDPCAGIELDSIDAYRRCYEGYYAVVIQMYQQAAECSRTTGTRSIIDQALQKLESQALDSLEDTVTKLRMSVDDSLAPCFDQLCTITGLLDPYIKVEASTVDLDAYRRQYYGADHFKYLADAVLSLQNLSLACTPVVRQVKKSLAAFDAIDKTAPNFCPWLKDSLPYREILSLKPLPRVARIDPKIDLRWYFNFTVTSMDSGSGGNWVATAEGGSELEKVNGFLFEQKVMIGTVAIAAGAAIGGAIGNAPGAAVGAAVGAVVSVVISVVEYFIVRDRVDDLKDYVDDKEAELDRIIAGVHIKEVDFNTMRDERCAAQVSITQKRIQDVVDSVDSPGHMQKMDTFFSSINSQVGWYNDLFSWAISDESGPSFLDLMAKNELLAKREAFYESIRQARTSQEVQAQKADVATLQGSISLLTCSSTATAAQKRATKTLLKRKVDQFNQLCEDITRTLERATVVIPYAGQTGSDVTCRYNGFLSTVKKVAIDFGTGTTARATVYDSNGVAVATIPDFSSDTSWPERTEIPGFECTSPTGLPFGKMASNRLQPGQYQLDLVNSIAGFGESDEATMRTFLKDTDANVRRKQMICLRMIDNPVYTIPRTATTCDIPTTF